MIDDETQFARLLRDGMYGHANHTREKLSEGRREAVKRELDLALLFDEGDVGGVEQTFGEIACKRAIQFPVDVRPKTFAEAAHDRLNMGLVRMASERRFKIVYIYWCNDGKKVWVRRECGTRDRIIESGWRRARDRRGRLCRRRRRRDVRGKGIVFLPQKTSVKARADQRRAEAEG